MKIVTCYVPGQLHDLTAANIMVRWVDLGNTWDLNPIDPDNPKHYGELLTKYWEAGEDFAIVEPDIVISDAVVEALTECDCEYGCFPYEWRTNIGPALGCTWFRALFLQKHPGVMREAAYSGVGWRQLDVVLMRMLLARKYNEQPHVHLPPVQHLNPDKRLEPDANREPMMEVPTR